MAVTSASRDVRVRVPLVDRPRPAVPGPLRASSLRNRLLLFVGGVLLVVCGTMGVTSVLAQRAYLIGNLDDRVHSSAVRVIGAAALDPSAVRDLGFLDESGQPAGLLAGRLGDDGDLLSGGVVRHGSAPLVLSAGQRAALAGVAADGTPHTRTVPGLGDYRVTVLARGDVRVLTGLPLADVQGVIGGLVALDLGIAGVGLAVAGVVCAVVIRRQLLPLGRVAATAVEVSRAPLGRGAVDGLTRVGERDASPRSEVGQVGAALNLMIDHVESSLAERQRGEERMRRFLADASHELRTPLAAIAGYAELMNRGVGAVEPVVAWRRVSAESARMTGLVEDLLLLARLDDGRALESGEVDLVAVVADAVRDARAGAAGDGREWRLRLAVEAGSAVVAGDAARLRQVVDNLLANACLHTPVGTTVVVEVARERRAGEGGATGEWCVVRVRDDGPGIPDALLPVVFERFTRGDASRVRGTAGGGAGLGLAVVAAVVGAHGGRVTVTSVPGRTEFTLALPVAASGGSGSRGHGKSAAGWTPLPAATVELDW